MRAYSDRKLDDLNEAALEETKGIGTADFRTVNYHGRDPRPDPEFTESVLTGPGDRIDWNRVNDVEAGTVRADVNGSGGEPQVLSSFDDWDHILHASALWGVRADSGLTGDGAAPPLDAPETEPAPEEAPTEEIVAALPEEVRDALATQPTAAFATSRLSGTAPAPVDFDATASVDPDGQVTEWQWDFGDGTTGTGETTAHTYAAPGVYDATLDVIDDTGHHAIGTATEEITVRAANAPPEARATAELTGTLPRDAAFDASDSVDPDGQVTGWEWDFGDGTNGTGETAAHSYTAPGVYTATV